MTKSVPKHQAKFFFLMKALQDRQDQKPSMRANPLATDPED
jgi:hypothetical protein